MATITASGELQLTARRGPDARARLEDPRRERPEVHRHPTLGALRERIVRRGLLADLAQPSVGVDVEQRVAEHALRLDAAVAHERVRVEGNESRAADRCEITIRGDRIVVVRVQHEERRVAHCVTRRVHGVGRSPAARPARRSARRTRCGRACDLIIVAHRLMLRTDHEHHVGDARVGERRDDVVEEGTRERAASSPSRRAAAALACSAVSVAAPASRRMRVPSPRARITACVVGADALTTVAQISAQDLEHSETAEHEHHEPHQELWHLSVEQTSRAEQRGVDEGAAEHPAEQRLRQRSLRSRAPRCGARPAPSRDRRDGRA